MRECVDTRGISNWEFTQLLIATVRQEIVLYLVSDMTQAGLYIS